MLTALDIDLKTLLMSKGDGDEWEEEPDVDSDIEEGDVDDKEVNGGDVDGGDDEDEDDEEEEPDEEEVV